MSYFSSDDMDGPVEDIGSRSCVTRFVKTLLSIMEHGVKPHSKHLTEYFAFLYEFAKMGEEEVCLNSYTEFFYFLVRKMFVLSSKGFVIQSYLWFFNHVNILKHPKARQSLSLI